MIEILQHTEPTGDHDSHGRPVYRVIKPIHYEAAIDWPIHVPVGYPTNLASIPWWAWWLIKPDDLPEAIIHDWLVGESIYNNPEIPRATRRMADLVFLEAMQKHNRPFWLRSTVWVALRASATWKRLTGRRKTA